MSCEDDEDCTEVEYKWTNLRDIDWRLISSDTDSPNHTAEQAQAHCAAVDPQAEARWMLTARANELWMRKKTTGCDDGCTCRPFPLQPAGYPKASKPFDALVVTELTIMDEFFFCEFEFWGTVTVSMVRRKGQCSPAEDKRTGLRFELPGTGVYVASKGEPLTKPFRREFSALVMKHYGKKPATKERRRKS